ncbi:MAG: hypothetical protein PHF86_10935 [Candidatus Nanoarchaeia archaeon]|jgi:hypothetical protein|nr:hypothetical protein [Candidatus Nanoarchaeia archaeon]
MIDMELYIRGAKFMLTQYNYLCPVANFFLKDVALDPLMLQYDTPFLSTFSWFKSGVRAKLTNSETILIIQVSAINEKTGIFFITIDQQNCEVKLLPFSAKDKTFEFATELYPVDPKMVEDICKFVRSGWNADTTTLQMFDKDV